MHREIIYIDIDRYIALNHFISIIKYRYISINWIKIDIQSHPLSAHPLSANPPYMQTIARSRARDLVTFDILHMHKILGTKHNMYSP